MTIKTERLQSEIKKSGRTTEEVAEIANLTKATVERAATGGIIYLQPKFVEQIAMALSIPVSMIAE